MVVAIVVAGAAVIGEAGIGHVFHEASRHVSNHMTPRQLTFSMSTIVFQSMGFYVMPFLTQSFFTAKSPDAIRRTQAVMPLYLLMYPFLVLVAYYALTQRLQMSSPNEAFFAVVVHLLPGWPERRQKRGAKIVIALYLVASIAMTLPTPNLMLTLNNVAYYGITQFFPGALIALLGWKVRPMAVATGILTGQALAVALYAQQADLGGINLGLVCLVANAIVTAGLNQLLKLMRTGSMPYSEAR